MYCHFGLQLLPSLFILRRTWMSDRSCAGMGRAPVSGAIILGHPFCLQSWQSWYILFRGLGSGFLVAIVAFSWWLFSLEDAISSP